MYRSVYDLTREELDELKESYFDQLMEYDEEEFGDIESPEEIDDEIIFEHYDGINFANETFERVYYYKAGNVADDAAIKNINYWSNSCGDLHYHGKYDITEDELPLPLKRVFHTLWGEHYDFPCYLMETKELGYCIGFLAEYDNSYANDLHVSTEYLWWKLCEEINRMKDNTEFEKAVIYALKDAGDFGGHNLIVCFPIDITEKELKRAAEVMDKYIYSLK